MALEVGIVGLPNNGKTTLFNALTHAGAEITAYASVTDKPNVGMATIADDRLDRLAALVGANTLRGARRRCPRCARRLEGIEVGGVPPLAIDRCPGGCGLWFDDGEMEQLIARFDEGETGAVARFFAGWFGKNDTVAAP